VQMLAGYGIKLIITYHRKVLPRNIAPNAFARPDGILLEKQINSCSAGNQPVGAMPEHPLKIRTEDIVHHAMEKNRSTASEFRMDFTSRLLPFDVRSRLGMDPGRQWIGHRDQSRFSVEGMH
jgi:hypothetical protein